MPAAAHRNKPPIAKGSPAQRLCDRGLASTRSPLCEPVAYQVLCELCACLPVVRVLSVPSVTRKCVTWLASCGDRPTLLFWCRCFFVVQDAAASFGSHPQEEHDERAR